MIENEEGTRSSWSEASLKNKLSSYTAHHFSRHRPLSYAEMLYRCAFEFWAYNWIPYPINETILLICISIRYFTSCPFMSNLLAKHGFFHFQPAKMLDGRILNYLFDWSSHFMCRWWMRWRRSRKKLTVHFFVQSRTMKLFHIVPSYIEWTILNEESVHSFVHSFPRVTLIVCVSKLNALSLHTNITTIVAWVINCCLTHLTEDGKKCLSSVRKRPSRRRGWCLL